MPLRNGRTTAVVREILQGSVHPPGSLVAFAGINAPDGWFLCHGQAISRTTYAELFLALGTTYGSGDGSTTFNLPDLRGRTAVGRDNMGGTAANRITSAGSGITGTTLGAAGGAQTHTLAQAELASHTHTQNAHTHAQNAHSHVLDNTPAKSFYAGSGGQGYAAGSTWTGPNLTPSIAATTATNQDTTATNQSTGSGSAHQNTQPSIILNYIIKF